jgi:hypothetical protein
MKYSEKSHLIFSELINGFSIENSEKFGDLYIKHQSHLDSIKIEKQYSYFFSRAIEQNIPTNKNREKIIISEGLWTKKEEDDFNNTKEFIRGARENLSREFLYSKRKTWRKEIADSENHLDALFIKKDYLIGSTAEKYANQQAFHFQIVSSFYKDSEFKERLEIDDTSSSEYEELITLYQKYQDKFQEENIKKIAISSFFTNLFYMCGDNAYYFYGKPIVSLTNHQTNLFAWGRYFKNLTGQYGDKIPKEMSENVDDTIEWFEITQNAEKSGILKDDENADGGMGSIMGATKKDMEMLGIDTSRVMNIGKEIGKKSNGMLTKDDLFNMTG